MTEPTTTQPRRSPATTLSARLPRWVPGAVVVVLLVAAAIVGGVSGWILLAAAAVVLAWLMAVTWPYLGTNGRLLQLALAVAAFALVIVRLVPRG